VGAAAGELALVGHRGKDSDTVWEAGRRQAKLCCAIPSRSQLLAAKFTKE
jgi:hypothetical protein